MSADAFRCYLCGSPDMALIEEIRQRPAGETDFGIPPDDYRRLILRCQNCRKRWKLDELKPLVDVMERVAPGELMPYGECPDCGAVCHPD